MLLDFCSGGWGSDPIALKITNEPMEPPCLFRWYIVQGNDFFHSMLINFEQIVAMNDLPPEQAWWFHWFVRHFQGDWIKPPTSRTEIQKHQRLFALCGFLGVVSSQDVVHPGAWDNCPSQERYLYTGKEGFPTLVWNVNVAHTRQILSMHGPFAGSKNDKTIVRTDPFVHKVR